MSEDIRNLRKEIAAMRRAREQEATEMFNLRRENEELRRQRQQPPPHGPSETLLITLLRPCLRCIRAAKGFLSPGSGHHHRLTFPPWLGTSAESRGVSAAPPLARHLCRVEGRLSTTLSLEPLLSRGTSQHHTLGSARDRVNTLGSAGDQPVCVLVEPYCEQVTIEPVCVLVEPYYIQVTKSRFQPPTIEFQTIKKQGRIIGEERSE
ncbi:hypothetical protein Fmac_003614 [Flemingia macrophylla]|uniref:Uncharacterized protein n=1 Tax=Flemingia macrophylla TaxID=520843 RepID=A0ABD1N2Q2_9FABA